MTWQTKQLGDLCDIKTGKKDVNEGSPDGKYPFFTCAREHTYSDVYSFDTEALLIAGNGDVGHVNYYKGKFEAYQRTYVLSGFKSVSPRYLFLFLDGFLKDTVSKQKLGNTMPYIKMGMLTDFKVPVPSFDEQEKVVEKLNEVFEKVTKAKEAAEKNLQNSKELFESYLQNVFANPGKNWEQTTVEKLVDQGVIYKPQDGNHGEIHPKKKDYVKNGVPFLMACDLKDGAVDIVNSKFISKKQAESLRTGFAKNDDVLLSHKATIGRSAVLQTIEEYAMLTPQVTYYRVKDKNRLFNYFIYYYFLSPRFQNEIFAYAEVGSTRAYIGITKQLKLTFIVPPLVEQKAIVKKLETLSAETKKLEKIYERKLADLEELKKSILSKAFHAEL
ncbi:MAG: restriction endonuclease subunit S [bacterium]|nr:restriction endonuclease subunit S [bacterium]